MTTIDPRRIEVMDDRVAEIVRRKTPAERLAIATGMWRSARRMIDAAIHQPHPDWTEAQTRREVARRMSRGGSG